MFCKYIYFKIFSSADDATCMICKICKILNNSKILFLLHSSWISNLHLNAFKCSHISFYIHLANLTYSSMLCSGGSQLCTISKHFKALLFLLQLIFPVSISCSVRLEFCSSCSVCSLLPYLHTYIPPLMG